MAPPISMPSGPACARRSPPPTTPTRSTRISDELAAQGAELRDSLVWAQGRIIADDPEAIARGKEADVVVAFIRGRVAELKEELLAEAPYFVLPAGAQATVKALHRAQRPGARADQLARFEQPARRAFGLCQDPQAAA